MYQKTPNRILKHLDFFLIDIILVTVSYVFSCFARYEFQIPEMWRGLYLRCGAALLIIYFLVALIGKNYKDILQRNKWAELARAATQVVFTFVSFIFYLYLVKENDFSRQIYIVSGILSLILIWLGRVFWKHLVRIHMARNNHLPQLLVICQQEDAQRLIQEIKAKQYDYFRVKGAVLYTDSGNDRKESIDTAGSGPDSGKQSAETQDYPEQIVTVKPVKSGRAGSGSTVVTKVVCRPEGLKKYLLSGVVDEVFVSLKDEKEEQRIIDYCLEMGITVHLGLAMAGMDYPNAMIGNLGGNTVLTTSNAVTDSWRMIVKRIIDILGGLAGCFILLILYLIVAPKIRRADPGPVFFRQDRVGKNGRMFKIYKFRSMYLDAEARKAELMAQNEMKGQIFKMENDPRILPGIGHFIRRTSIDEWPQFINVLKGDMSLVGTRPPTADEFAQYEPHHKARLSFKPGITGLWQVSGRSQITDFEKIVELDNQYIREWSLKLDYKILLKTVGVVIRHEGAE